MYHCHIHFYLVGNPYRVFEVIKKIPPLESFTHEFLESSSPEGILARRADVILADLGSPDVKEKLQILIENRKAGSRLICLAEKNATGLLEESLLEIEDIWIMPMSDKEVSFRFLRWQQSFKMSRDFLETSQYLETTINSIPNLIWYKDKNGIHEKVNDSFCKTVNKAKNQVEGRGHAYIWDVEKDDPACVESENKVMSERVTCVSEEIIQTGEGMRTLTTYKSPLYDMDGSVMGTVGVGIDVTNERAYEHELEKKKERRQVELIQALAIDYNLVCFFDLDTGKGYPLRNADDSGNEFVHGLAREISLEESMGTYMKFVHEEDREMLWEAFQAKRLKADLKEKKSCCVNCRIIRNGKTEYFQVKAVRAGTWDRYCGVVLGFHSVDEETRSEMEKKSLLEDALLQANKANKAKSVFLSNMSHDIRTPMNAIVGFTSLAITHIERRDQVEEYLKKIMSSGNHLLNLINDVLDMSHIESGKMHLEEKPCNLPEILHELCNILQADVRKKKLRLQADAVDVLNEEVYCDKLRLNQVLLNLFSNSVKYTNDGGSITLRVVEKGKASGGYANYEFSIRDTGIGMSEEFVAHIFEPFERESNSTISGIQGTGLGMSITKSIVDAMKGTIKVKSKQGEGTEFIVSFTFRVQDERDTNQEITQWKGSRILVVKEDPESARHISGMLEQLGMEPEQKALQHIAGKKGQDTSYSACIIDWLAPDMDVVKTIREIREGLGKEIPVIVTSAYDWSEIEDKARENGIAIFCSKPLFTTELKNCLYFIATGEKIEETDIGRIREQLHAGRILLAEDVELNQEIAVAILEDAGFSAEVAENGQVAVDMLSKSEPGYYQLVLMDIQMPVMNGYEATKAIRRLENKELASIPILAMSANAFEEDRRESLKCGMNGHIAKPIDIDKLLDTLSKALC